MTPAEESAYRRKWARHSQKKRVAEGRCIACCAWNFNGFQRCDTCREKNRVYQEAYRK